MRAKFDEQLDLLNRELIWLGAMCEEAISKSVKALEEGNIKLAEKVTELMSQIDQKEREIEGMCFKLLLHQQPVAKDFRVISSALKMVTDMKRIGVQSADIAEIISMDSIHASDDTMKICSMAGAVTKMVTESIEAFVKKDVQIAEEVVKYDDVVDQYFDEVKRGLISKFNKSESEAESALDLLMIAKYLERIGDHAVNIAEWVQYSITGHHGGDIE